MHELPLVLLHSKIEEFNKCEKEKSLDSILGFGIGMGLEVDQSLLYL